MRENLPWMSVNGVMSPRDKAVVPALDWGVMYGHGLFTTIKVRGSVPLFIERHTERLAKSIEMLIDKPFLFEHPIVSSVQEVIRANNLFEGAIRITVTAGLSSDWAQPNIIVHATLPREKRAYIDAITIPEQRDSLKVMKLTYRLLYSVLEKQASQMDAQEVLFVEQGSLVEGTYHSICSVDADGMVLLPPIIDKGLNGITRQLILDNTQTRIIDIPAKTNAPLYLMNSLNVVPIRRLDGELVVQERGRMRVIEDLVLKLELDYSRNYKNSLA